YSTSSFLSIHLFPPLPPPPPPPTLFPYTTLFRSLARPRGRRPAPRCLHRGAPARGGGGDPRQSEPVRVGELPLDPFVERLERSRDRKSTRLNSSHVAISYAVFCLKKKKKIRAIQY